MRPANILLLVGCLVVGASTVARGAEKPKRPNILVVISDDQSFAHTSAAGCKAVQTPAFDRIASEGVFFRNGFAASPGCSPSRASLLTGRHPWQLEEAGTHGSNFPKKYPVFPDLLEADGYAVGCTGKGWGPGVWTVSGRTRNPAGPEFSKRNHAAPTTGMSTTDYAGNLKDFLSTRKDGQPFCFWFGAIEPHRGYEAGSGLKSGKRLEDVVVPPFLPDTPEVRSDLLDYLLEIEWFDAQLARALSLLEETGELENTLIIVTSDNGMPFPRAKANCYEYGIHVPLAIRWGAKARGGRSVDDLVGFVDLTATILDAARVKPPSEYPLSGRSIIDLLSSEKQGMVDPSRDVAWAARERHTSARYQNWTYPQRALRTPQYLYIQNQQPDRWPAGDPRALKASGELGPITDGYYDIDRSPTKNLLIENPALDSFLQLAVAKRPAEELFDITVDPACLRNLAADPSLAKIKQELSQRLTTHLQKTGDPRATGHGEIWESYPRYSNMRNFPAPENSK